MSISTRPNLFGRTAEILPFLPRFAGTVPLHQRAIEQDVRVGVESQALSDLFLGGDKKHVRVVLMPKSEEHLEEFALMALQAQDAAAAFSQILKTALLGAKDDSLEAEAKAYKPGDEAPVIAYFDLDATPAPKGKLSAKKQEEADRAKAHANTTALVKAYEAQLDRLGEDVTEVTAVLPKTLPDGVDSESLIREMATIATLKGYNYNFHKRNHNVITNLTSVLFNQTTANPATVREGQVLGHAMNLTRHLVDSPANRCTTKYFSDKALALKSATLDVDVLSGDDLAGNTHRNDKEMGLFLSVAQGNDEDSDEKKPRLVEMVHTPPGWDPKTGKTVMLVGKGIIFDTGGTDLKINGVSHNMRGDMAGAAAVLGTMKALDDMPVGVRVIGLMPLTENRIGGKASLPQDIYTARSGNEVYISNTDAEGRLILADAMNYGLEKYNGQLDAAFTIATLTGGKVRSIGEHNAVGISGNNPAFLEGLDKVVNGQLRRTTKGTHPLDQRHYKMVTSSSPADVQNASRGAAKEYAGLIKPEDIVNKNETAFSKRYSKQGEHDFMLSSFTDGAAFIQAAGMDPNAPATKGKIQHNVPWGHYDIAGAEFGPRDVRRNNHEWASGIGVEDLYYSLRGIADGAIEPTTSKTKLPKFIPSGH